MNPYIDFANSPFVVQRSLQAWQRPKLAIDVENRPGEMRELPRIAGISSFGAGGSNAHILIEEYVADELASPDGRGHEPYLIVLSAKTAERLQEVVANLHQALTRDARYTDDDLPTIAYTLQIGREAMVERLAFLATSMEELVAKLQACLAAMSGTDPHALDQVADLFRGRVGGGPHQALAAYTEDDELQDAIDKWVQRKKFAQLLRLWVEGLAFDWRKLYGEHATYGLPPRRISLPTYPFARESYWVPVLAGGAPASEAEVVSAADVSAARYSAPRPAAITREQLVERTTAYFKEVLASVLKISADLIEADVPMEDFGLDSIMVMQVTNHLEKAFGSLSKTLFFEYQNIQALSEYFTTAYADTLAQLFGTSENAATPVPPPTPLQRPMAARPSVIEPWAEEGYAVRPTHGTLDIAIIGLAGRYPGANDPAEFWHNLRTGTDCISEIPQGALGLLPLC